MLACFLVSFVSAAGPETIIVQTDGQPPIIEAEPLPNGVPTPVSIVELAGCEEDIQ